MCHTNVKKILELAYDIWSNFHVELLDWIVKDFELKIKNCVGL
jgi:hypothetical protein